MRERKEHELGSFVITSGEVVISDPCYSLETWCQVVDKAANGIWTASVETSDEGSWGVRCAILRAKHQSVGYPCCTERIKGSLGVDSGQLGFFDKSNYRNDECPEVTTVVNPLCPDEPWYSLCCDKTCDESETALGAGVIPNGVVSSSGYGDGSYQGWVERNADGEIVAVEIIFIEEEDEENDYEDYDDDYGDEDEDESEIEEY